MSFIAVRFFESKTVKLLFYGNCAASSKPILKLFNVANLELNKVYSFQK